jgi:hypothetical protein
MTATKRTSEETAPFNYLGIKRARNSRNSVIPPAVPEPGQRTSSNHDFLDDATGFADGLSLRQFINPQAAKLYNTVRVNAFAFS